ncbi:uncharacterized protein ACRADG_000898 isoform 1-T1 [Cochliomyia hominivorax]
MSINKAQKLKLQALQKEQVQLVKIENILTNLLGKVNESLNELKVRKILKVEELQIKSNIIEQYTATNCDDEKPSTSAQAANRLNINPLMIATETLNLQQTNSTLDMEGIEDINKQMLALESLLVPLKKNNFKEEQEEEEEEDDDDHNNDDCMTSENEENEDD